ncbi:hypothetical protein F511_07933 [Dorcoceras hygrometricum]|uniref:Uncharacterized protein n=1 Tax=Dorcoceras hygrometricum TaxID=472368 RepID=A0A2Z7D760_9LAMI|nr:hypothetical protein F511_07933 [Dorcoceras hygrometricum]
MEPEDFEKEVLRKMLKEQKFILRFMAKITDGHNEKGCEGERRYRTLISLLGSLATISRVVNYHSSWARQQQVELFDASGNPGFTAGRGFNPAGGAPGGG